jgi:cardiolipin synthase A/B
MIAPLDSYTSIVAVVVPIVHLTGLYCAGRAIMHTRTAPGAIAWAVSLLALPYIAVPLYAVFGRRKFVGYINARRRGDHEIQHIASELTRHEEQFRTRFETRKGRLRAAEQLAKMPFTAGNEATLLIDGEATFDSIFEGIDAATDYVLIQFYIVEDDGLGHRLKEKLVARAAEGIRVFFLFDEIGSHSLPRSYLDELRDAGVRVHPFHTTRGRKNRFQINFRNHRKIVIVDGRCAWVGGHNVGDAYLGLSAKMGAWRDTHCKVEGPAVQCVQLSFLEDWYWASHSVPRLEWQPQSAPGGEIDVLAVPSGPADSYETASLLFVMAINSATERLWIASPYFVPDDRVVAALQLAALRGVDVRVVLPEKADHLLMYLSAFSYIEELGDAGVKILRYQPGFLHQKTFLVDDKIAAIGTANLDNRSFRLNFEITLVFLSEAFTEECAEMFEADFERCKPFDREQLARRSFGFRFLVRASRLLAPVQ